ncbi:MAG TPA: sigma factor-like helix-turn-helix DNA-binding protein [Marmoricola sp.]|nr:sigma factor-like helix-turn-helix DNA-binding protein [Marmoricola sp.]
MHDPADFDELYLSSRRRLVLQAYALTGDLAAAAGAVRDAFVAARERWRTVSRLDDPETWVRARSWTIAQRRALGRSMGRPGGRARHRDLQPVQRQVVAALQSLPDAQRKTLLLNHLATLSLAEIGREVGETRARTEQLLQRATAAMAVALDADSTSIRSRLEQLAPVARGASLPRVTTVHRAGVRRRRARAVLAAVLATVVAVGAGALVTEHPQHPANATVAGTFASPDRPSSSPANRPVDGSMLLQADQLGRAAPHNDWAIWSTTDNTDGSGLNTDCQQARFADPRGLAAFVRTFTATGRPHRHAVQTVEVSRSPRAARRAYRTVLEWYAGCSRTRTQLQATYDVAGVGDQAGALVLRLGGRTPRSYSVGLARTGAVTTSTVVETSGGPAVGARALAEDLATAVDRLCGADLAGSCADDRPRVRRTLPPATGERAGMLAVADLPFVDHLARPWVGTTPVRSRDNVAATPCDRADFRDLGAGRVTSRTFLVPQARLPERFGLSETYGRFPRAGRAVAALRTIEHRVARCSHADLGASVHHATVVGRSRGGSSYASWRIDVEIGAHRRVGYWMGVARVGRYLAQVTFSPVPGKDISPRAFRDLVERARDRLLELPE